MLRRILGQPEPPASMVLRSCRSDAVDCWSDARNGLTLAHFVRLHPRMTDRTDDGDDGDDKKPKTQAATPVSSVEYSLAYRNYRPETFVFDVENRLVDVEGEPPASSFRRVTVKALRGARTSTNQGESGGLRAAGPEGVLSATSHVQVKRVLPQEDTDVPKTIDLEVGPIGRGVMQCCCCWRQFHI